MVPDPVPWHRHRRTVIPSHGLVAGDERQRTSRGRHSAPRAPQESGATIPGTRRRPGQTDTRARGSTDHRPPTRHPPPTIGYQNPTPFSSFRVPQGGINDCRVGKGRPAGSIELRVSPFPSKIPYGGFSPVRLQMDRQWRPSTTSRGLSAVHIRPMRPSYTPPQLQLPGIRDPRRDYPFENLSVQCGTTPNNCDTSIQRPLARHRVMLSRRVIAYYGLMRASESLPAAYGFAAGAAALSGDTKTDPPGDTKTDPLLDTC